MLIIVIVSVHQTKQSNTTQTHKNKTSKPPRQAINIDTEKKRIPALDRTMYPIQRPDPGCRFRYVNFVEVIGKGTKGVSTTGVAAIFMSFESGPISVDPICPRPRSSSR